MTSSTKSMQRARRRLRHKDAVRGTAARPRLSVFRSNQHLYAQVIDDSEGRTLVQVCTRQKDVVEGLPSTRNLEAARKIGQAVAQRARAAGIETVVFDKSGYRYHGRVKALADAARESGLKF